MNQPAPVKFGRCDFCPKRAVVQFSRQSRYSSRGHRRAMTLNYRSCAEHEGSPAWRSILDLYADAAAKAVRVAVQSDKAKPVCNCGASTAAPLRDHHWACNIVRAVEQ